MVKVEASIVGHVHLTAHEGTNNADMDEIYIFLGERSQGLCMGWWLVIDYLGKSSNTDTILPCVKVIFTFTYLSC